MVKFTKEELLDGKLDPTEINLSDIKAFCMENGLEDFEVSSEMTKEAMLNGIAEQLEGPSSTTAAEPVPEEEPEFVPITVKQYADSHGMTCKEVQEKSGKTHWNMKLDQADIKALSDKPADPVEPPKKKMSSFRAKRIRLAEEGAKRRLQRGRVEGTNYMADQYAGIPLEELPGRIRRNIERQQK